jgi:HK97 family phage prohead protease
MREHKPNPRPERATAKISDLEVCQPRSDGQFEFTAYAHEFNKVNDRVSIIREGAFAKTILERVAADKVLVNDAHAHTTAGTIGKVVEAREDTRGLFYRGRISATEEEIFTKMRERVVQQNSIEFFTIREATTLVPFEDVPVGAFIFEESKGDGMVEAREILEVVWLAVAILPFSSEDRNAILETNCAIPFQDLGVATAAEWDSAAAAARIAEWAGTTQRRGGSIPNYAKLARAYLIRGPIRDGAETFLGQIADVQDGQLVVVPRALDDALAELARVDQLQPQDLVQAAQDVGRYREKLQHAEPIRVLAASAPEAGPVAEPVAGTPSGGPRPELDQRIRLLDLELQIASGPPAAEV